MHKVEYNPELLPTVLEIISSFRVVSHNVKRNFLAVEGLSAEAISSLEVVGAIVSSVPKYSPESIK